MRARKYIGTLFILLGALFLVACGEEIDYGQTNGNNMNNLNSDRDYVVEKFSSEYETYHNFFLKQYQGQYAMEIYADITHDSREDLIVVGIVDGVQSCSTGFIHIYTLEGNTMYSLYETTLDEAHMDGFNRYCLIKQNGLYYLAYHSEAIWHGLGGSGYDIFWFDNLQIAYAKQQYYTTADDLTGDDMIAEMNYAREVWGAYYQEFIEITEGAMVLLSDTAAIVVGDMNAAEFIDRLGRVGEGGDSLASGTVDIVTNWGTCQQNAQERGLLYVVQTKDYNKYYDSSEWGDYEHKAPVGCGLSCKTMMLYALGAVNPKTGERYYAKDLVAANGGSAAHDGYGVKAAMKDNGIVRFVDVEYRNINDENPFNQTTIEAMSERLDAYLDLYAREPDKYSPPMVSIYFVQKKNGVEKRVDHFILVVGKEADGTYVCIDPNLNGRATFYPSDSVKTDSTSYTSPIRGLHVLYKE